MLEDLIAMIAEFRSDRLGVADGVGEARKMLVLADANDKCDALGVGQCRRGSREHEEERRGKDTKHGSLAFPFARSGALGKLASVERIYHSADAARRARAWRGAAFAMIVNRLETM